RSALRSPLDRALGLDGRVARVGHHLAALVPVFRLADDEEHLPAPLPLLLEHLLGARAEGQDVAGADGLQVLELLLAVQEVAVVELDRRARLAEVADPVGDRHEEGRRRDRARGIAVLGLVVLHRLRELADLPELDLHRPFGPPHADQRTIDLGHFTTLSAGRRARGSRWRRRRSPRSSWRA